VLKSAPMATGAFSRAISWAVAATLLYGLSQAQQPAHQPAQIPSTPAATAFWNGTDPNAHVTILENSLIRVITNTPLIAGKTREGTPVLLTLSQDVVIHNVLIIPRGAVVHGMVVQSRKAGTLNGKTANLVLKLVSLDFGGNSYPLYTYQLKVEGATKEAPTGDVVNGAYYGALAGEIVNARTHSETTRGQTAVAMGAGAVVGAGVGTAVSAISSAPPLEIPAETQMDFYLASPISVVPVSAMEAARLSKKLPEGGPVLYVRGDRPQ
jgi:hypothetical protein